jgi:hypothetical protein
MAFFIEPGAEIKNMPCPEKMDGFFYWSLENKLNVVILIFY